MDYKISYPNEWNSLGSHYDQRVRITLTADELNTANETLRKRKEEEKESRTSNFYLFAHELRKGRNYTTITTAHFFADLFGYNTDKRYKNDRNTIIKVELTK